MSLQSDSFWLSVKVSLDKTLIPQDVKKNKKNPQKKQPLRLQERVHSG